VRELKVIAFTHKTTDIKNIGKLHIDVDKRKERLSRIKELGVSELMYLSTCNRVEFVFVHDKALSENFLYSFFAVFNPDWDDKDVRWAMANCNMFEGLESVRHIFKIASSLDSLVVGEREIITQVRKSFDECSKLGLTGDIIRLLINKTIESAKEVYTKTNIARNPVSIVSLAYRKLRELNIKENSRILVVGAGETNTNMCRFLSKHGLKNLTMFNRTLSKAEFLTNHIGGNSLPLSELESFNKGFDLIVTCTGSDEPIITPEIYKTLIGDDKSKKTIVDLAIPYDVAPKVIEDNSINYIEIEGLKSISAQNIKEREKELTVCDALIEEQLIAFKQAFKERQVEIVMREVPQKIKEIKEFALTQVFAKEMEEMEDESKEVLDKMLAYIEKKYISVPMKMAKEILLDNSSDKSYLAR
jgi:glutamyl-tRNA reductase